MTVDRARGLEHAATGCPCSILRSRPISARGHRHQRASRRRRGDPLVMLVRETALKVRLQLWRAAAHRPGAVRELSTLLRSLCPTPRSSFDVSHVPERLSQYCLNHPPPGNLGLNPPRSRPVATDRLT